MTDIGKTSVTSFCTTPQQVTVEAIDDKGTATLQDSQGERLMLNLSGQQYLDYGLVSTTYSSQGKTAEQVLASIDSTLSKEGLYVAVSRAKSNLKLYTADKQQLYQRAQRSAAKANPSDYLPLFKLVNPHAENEKATDAARELRGADQSEYLGDLVGKRVEVSHRAAIRRDSADGGRSEPAAVRAESLPPEYVANVRGVVTRIEERRRAEELERQAERLGEAAESILGCAGQLEQTAAAISRLDEQLEQKAERLSAIRAASKRELASQGDAEQLSSAAESTVGQKPSRYGGGVFEAIMSRIDPDGLARYEAEMAEAQRPAQPTVEKQEPVKRQEQPEQRRKKKAKKRDRGMEM